jgi:hypothetical protein
MARQLRMEYAGAIYHVMSGGYRKEAIFVNDEDRRRFLRTLGDVCECAGWGACILSQEQSFPRGCRNAETNPCDRDEVVWGNLHSALQCAASDEGTSDPQTLWKALWPTSAKCDDTRD